MIADGEAEMALRELRLWDLIRIHPIKWQLPPWGDQGNGFWVVAIFGRNVVWYNDIEEGFNRSPYANRGIFGDYRCNGGWDRDLQMPVRQHFLMKSTPATLPAGLGHPLRRRPSRPLHLIQVIHCHRLASGPVWFIHSVTRVDRIGGPPCAP